jgi:hypothetical protein
MAARKDKTQRDRDFLAKRRAGFTAVLKKLGVDREFARLPQALRNRIYILRVRPAPIEFAPGIAKFSSAAELKQDIARLLDHPIIDVMGNGQKLSFNEVWWVVVSLYANFGPTTDRTGASGEVARALGPIATDEVIDTFTRLDHELELRLMFAAMQRSRIDHMFYGADIRNGTPGTDAAARRIHIFGVEPRKRLFDDAGQTRTAYQMGFCGAREISIWAEWDPSLLSLPPGPKLPIYVQSHVLQRLMERMPGERGESKRGGLHTFLCDALVNPEIVQHDGGTYWIALRDYQRARLGYLLAEVVDGAVLVKTYQFLTMHGSPEAKCLYRRLGARRGDFEHLRLDQLATFVETDLADDAELQNIFAGCGCGHLFDLRRKWEWPQSADHRTAGWVREYLKLGPSQKPAA